MATEKQYQFFKSLYDEENRRYAELADRAKMYIGVITLYVGAISFKIEDIAKFAKQENVPIWLFLFVGVVFVGALLFSVWAVFVRDYEGICDPEALVQQFGNAAPVDDDFYADRIVEVAVAVNRNVTKNDDVARRLSIASWLLFLGVLIHMMLLLYAVFR